MRSSSILGLLICSAIIVNVADAKPFIIKVFAPSSGYTSRATPTAAPVNTQFISSLISTKFQLLNSLLQAKSSFGGFGITKTFGFTGSSTTTTTESPYTQGTTEVNTDFIPEVSSSTQSVSTTTTEDDTATPQPTVRPQPPVTTTTTASAIVPTTTTAPIIPTKSTTEEDRTVETTTRATNGYTYQAPY